jgi:hypothetical protein
LVVPPSGMVIASKKSAREARSTIGVPRMPMRSNRLQLRWSPGTGGPTFRCQIMLPSTASGAYTLFDWVTAMIIALPLGPPSM